MSKRNQKLNIFDCDPGIDDALTLCLGSSLLSHPMVVITSYGCSNITHTTRNAHRLLDLMGRKDVPVIRGSPRPLMWQHPLESKKLPTFFGHNGLNNVRLPVSKGPNILTPHDDHFVEHVAKILRTAGTVDYYLTGPCTNLARVCLRYPDLVKDKLNRLFIMGGAIGPGNIGTKDTATGLGVCEFNFYLDPIATNVVLSLGLKPKLVSWDQAKEFHLPKSKVCALRSKHHATNHLLMSLRNFFDLYPRDTVSASDRQEEPFVILSDPIVLLTDHKVGKLTNKHIQIVTEGEHFGRSIESPEGYAVDWIEFTNTKSAMSILLEGIGAKIG